MSGHVPSFIEKGKKVLYGGKEVIVKDYFFTSPSEGCPHNTDVLMLKLEGFEKPVHAFDVKAVNPTV